ncbi:MAG: VgrG-related protein [Caldilineaceae bacterium]
MDHSEIVSHISIKIGGEELPDAIRPLVLEVKVDQHVHLPGMFTLRLQDVDLKLLDKGPFGLAKKVEISARDSKGRLIKLIQGEITDLEPDFGTSMIAELLVRGYDESHRLYRETKSRAFLNVKDSDVVNQIVGESSELRAGQIDNTSVIYDHIFQHNQSDLAFLMQRAWRIGFECYVDDGRLFFRKPPTSGEGKELTWGDELLWFKPRMSLSEQVDEVVVRGWDVDKQEPIIGRAQAQNGALFPEIKDVKGVSSTAEKFGHGKLTIVDRPVFNQTEADALAKARMDELSGALVEAEGQAFRRPDLKAGKIITLKALGERFSGDYLITSVNHVYRQGGFFSTFTVRGARCGLLSEELQGASQPQDKWPGVVTAVVTNTDDPLDWGRVKLKYPWMSDEAESDWARVVGVGAGPTAGIFAMPQVNDEVLVAFVHGDFSQPCVLGGVWNGQNAPPPESIGAASGEKPLVRTWHSCSGHWIAMYDNADNKIEITTAGGHSIVLDDAGRSITLKTTGGSSITMDDMSQSIKVNSPLAIQVESGAKIEVTTGGMADIKVGGAATVQTGGILNVQSGGVVNIQAAAALNFTAGAAATINAPAGIALIAGGPLMLKGLPIIFG